MNGFIEEGMEVIQDEKPNAPGDTDNIKRKVDKNVFLIRTKTIREQAESGGAESRYGDRLLSRLLRRVRG